MPSMPVRVAGIDQYAFEGGNRMLMLKPNCDCCDRDLSADSTEALICSFECTFCRDCVQHRLPHGRCPNCGGEFVRRPVRPADRLARFPASAERFVKQHAFCADGVGQRRS